MTQYQTDNLIVYDLEVFPGYFLAGFELPDGLVYQYVITPEDASWLPELQQFLAWYPSAGFELAGFNSKGYDDLVLTNFMRSPHPDVAYQTSQDIIVNQVPRWKFDNDFNSIDLMQILPGRIGLKKIGVCLGHHKLQELPIPYDKTPTAEDRKVLLGYNRNDLEITRKLQKEIQPELDLRRVMSERYNVDMRSLGEATMAETAILQDYWTSGGVMSKKDLNKRARYIVETERFAQVFQPSWWTQMRLIQNPSLEPVFKTGEQIFATPIPIVEGNLSGSALNKQVYIDDRYYTMGVGGLHSIDGPGCWIPTENQILVDIDVASYYPNLILTQQLAPRQWGADFLPLYQDIVDRRMKAKREGDKVTAQILKISANGTYGKTSEEFSSLYDPQMTANVTVVGQLSLLCLVALLTGTGQTVSANTDGITVLVDRSKYPRLQEIVSSWEGITGLEMEYTEYQALYQRDVNNYIALKKEGGAKTKGRFVADWPDLRHTPNANIVALAIKAMVEHNTSLEETIYGCQDINQFLLTQNVTGNWTTSWNDAPLGKMLRFYKSNRADAGPITRTPGEDVKGNQGTVANSDGCVPVEDLPETFPNDINYAWYVQEAKELWDIISVPKRPGMTRWAEVIRREGLRPCLVNLNAKQRSRAAVKYGKTDFTSMLPGWCLGTGTGEGLLAQVFDDRVEIFQVERRYPSKTRKLVKRDYDFELIYGARVPLIGSTSYQLSQASLGEEVFDEYYTKAELKKVGRDV